MSILISPFQGRLTSSWGPRERHPVTGQRGFHRGEDIAPVPAGTRGRPVYAPCDLEILFVTPGTYSSAQKKWLGNDYTSTWNSGPLVVARGRGKFSGYWFAFGHMVGITVKAGQKVPVGTVLGEASDKGNVSGVHLHFEIWTSSKQGGGLAKGNTIDPVTFYREHGVELGSTPDLTKTATSPSWNGLDMTITLGDIARVVRDETSEVIRKANNINNAALHGAMRTEAQKAAEDVLRRLPAVPGVTAADVERIRVAILGDRHPAMPSTDLRGLIVSIYRDLQTMRALVEALSGALAAVTSGGETFDVDKFLAGVDERIETRMAGLTDEVIDSLAVDVTVGKKE